MARSDPRRALAAQLSAIAAAYAQVRQITAAEALEEIAASLIAGGAKPGTEAARVALTMAAALYAVERPEIDEWWYPVALDVLVQAGADESAARATRLAGQ
jgi:hypothetical protein